MLITPSHFSIPCFISYVQAFSQNAQYCLKDCCFIFFSSLFTAWFCWDGHDRLWCSEVVLCCDIYTFSLNPICFVPSASHSSPATSICFLPICHTSTPLPWHKAAAQLRFPAWWTSFPTNQKLTTTGLSQLWILSCLLHAYKMKAVKKLKQIHSPSQTKTKMKTLCWNKISPCMLVCPGEKTWNKDDRHLLHSSEHYFSACWDDMKMSWWD